MIVFNCPNCNLQIKVPDQAAGRIGTCPQCKNKVRVPELGYSAAIPAAPGASAPASQMPCPSCGEMISTLAKKCRFCGEMLGNQAGQMACPSCGEMISSRANQCRFCGEPFGKRGVPARRAPSSRYDDVEEDYAPAPRPRDTGRYPTAHGGGRRSSGRGGRGREGTRGANGNMSFSQEVIAPISDDTFYAILDALEQQFHCVSASTRCVADHLEVDSISGTSGYWFNVSSDFSIVTVEENRSGDGYVATCDTKFKPGSLFWIFFIIDLVLSVTIIGMLIGMGITLWLYYSQKSYVETTIRNIFYNIQREIEG